MEVAEAGLGLTRPAPEEGGEATVLSKISQIFSFLMCGGYIPKLYAAPINRLRPTTGRDRYSDSKIPHPHRCGLSCRYIEQTRPFQQRNTLLSLEVWRITAMVGQS